MSRAKILVPFLLDLVSFCEAFADVTSTFKIFKNNDIFMQFHELRLASDHSRHNQCDK